MKIGDKVIVKNQHMACFNGKTGMIVAECIPNSQLHMLMGIVMWKVKFDEPFDAGYGAVTEWEFSEGSLMLN